MHFPRVTLFTKKTKKAGPLVSEHSSSTESLASTTSTFSDFPSSEEDILREYQMLRARAHYLGRPYQFDELNDRLGNLRRGGHPMFLVPLDVAASTSVIRYRKEGFEMEEERREIREAIRGY